MAMPFIATLKALCSAEPTRAKWVIVRSHGIGWTLGDRLALEGTNWANLRFVTPLDLALRMGAPFLVERGIDPSEEGLGPALVMRLLLAQPEEGGYFRPLAHQPQLASALWATLRELRMAGLGAADLKAQAFVSEAKHAELCALVDAYEAYLTTNRRGDAATVYLEALQHADWSPIQPTDLVAVQPDVTWSPLERQLINFIPGERVAASAVERRTNSASALERTNASAGRTDKRQLPLNFERPAPVSFFSSGGPEAEIEEVFRRIVASGVQLDTVEIACASEPYAALIWEKALRYEWPVTLATGIPATLLRPGRALLGFAEWIEDDFAAGRLRRLLQSGDVSLGERDLRPGRAARLLVRAQAAWGRTTYRLALGRVAASARARAERDDLPGDERDRLRSRAAEADALAAWINAIVEAVPVEDERGTVNLQALVPVAERLVADATARASALDHAAASRLERAIRELRALRDYRCSMGAALRFLRERVETLSVGGDRARPGHLHVSRLAESGLAGRAHLFVVGLEEGRVFPAAFEDPVLLDQEREAISPDLRRSRDRVDEAVRKVMGNVTSALSQARDGRTVTFSFSCRDLREFRETYASWVMLEAFRLASDRPNATYQDLHDHMGAPVSAVPASPERALGEGRWWLHGVTRAGEPAGRAAVVRRYPALAAGLAAEAARDDARFTEFDGLVPAAGAALDPCRPEAVVSPTQLEDAAACPFRYFLRRGLGVDAIESGDRDRDLWIDASLRGSLLHDLYARLLRRCRDAKRKPSVAEDRAWLRDAAAATLANLAQEMPPPSDEIHERESRGFIDDLDLFLEHEIVSADKRTPIGLEVAFGGRSRADDGEPLSVGEPVTVVVAGITLRVAGRIDRIDRMADGTFEILDYKTGGFYADAWKGTYAGGRRLQHALYGLAALELLKKTTKKPALGGAEYYFSSVKGGSHRKRIPVQTPARIGRVLSDLRDVLTSGTFVHAPKKDDCKFCDYGSACGARAHERAKPKIRDAALEAYRRLQDHE